MVFSLDCPRFRIHDLNFALKDMPHPVCQKGVRCKSSLSQHFLDCSLNLRKRRKSWRLCCLAFVPLLQSIPITLLIGKRRSFSVLVTAAYFVTRIFSRKCRKLTINSLSSIRIEKQDIFSLTLALVTALLLPTI